MSTSDISNSSIGSMASSYEYGNDMRRVLQALIHMSLLIGGKTIEKYHNCSLSRCRSRCRRSRRRRWPPARSSSSLTPPSPRTPAEPSSAPAAAGASSSRQYPPPCQSPRCWSAHRSRSGHYHLKSLSILQKLKCSSMLTWPIAIGFSFS